VYVAKHAPAMIAPTIIPIITAASLNKGARLISTQPVISSTDTCQTAGPPLEAPNPSGVYHFSCSGIDGMAGVYGLVLFGFGENKVA